MCVFACYRLDSFVWPDQGRIFRIQPFCAYPVGHRHTRELGSALRSTPLSPCESSVQPVISSRSGVYSLFTSKVSAQANTHTRTNTQTAKKEIILIEKSHTMRAPAVRIRWATPNTHSTKTGSIKQQIFLLGLDQNFGSRRTPAQIFSTRKFPT